MIHALRATSDRVLALFVALLPRARWDDWNLPVANMSLLSATLTFFTGGALGITGYFEYMAMVLAQREFTLPPFMLAVFISYVFLTPRGLISLYLLLSGMMRMISGWLEEPLGDLLLTAVDELATSARRSRRARAERRARRRLEGVDEPDRRYVGAWAGLPQADFVIVSARRKPGWSKGTCVMTSDGWFVLGEPFDRAMPNGLRTVYPLTAHRTLDVLRKGVTYELPPLTTWRHARMETARPPLES